MEELCPSCGGTNISEVWYDPDSDDADDDGVTKSRPNWADGTCPGQGGSSGDSPAVCNGCGYKGTLGEFWQEAEWANEEEEEDAP